MTSRITTQPSQRQILLVAVVLLISLNLRPALTSLGPVTDLIQADLGINPTEAGLMASLPVFCFGIGALITPNLITRFGMDAVIWAGLIGTGAATLVRSYTPSPTLWVGTIILGLAIGLLNGALPAVIKRDFPAISSRVMGFYSATLTLGAGVASDLAVPLAQQVDWKFATSVWAVLSLLGMAAWAVTAPRRRALRASVSTVTSASSAPSAPAAAASAPRATVRMWRVPLAWAATAYMGLQSLLFYTWVQWLPDLQKSHGFSAVAAGQNMFWFQMAGIVSTSVLTAVQGNRPDQRVATTVASVLWAAGIVGTLVAPAGMTWWLVVMGLGSGLTFSLALGLITARTGSAVDAARLSGMIQSLGYMMAAVGPAVAGQVVVAAGWDVVLWAALGVTVVIGVLGLVAGRPVVIGKD